MSGILIEQVYLSACAIFSWAGERFDAPDAMRTIRTNRSEEAAIYLNISFYPFLKFFNHQLVSQILACADIYATFCLHTQNQFGELLRQLIINFIIISMFDNQSNEFIYLQKSLQICNKLYI